MATAPPKNADPKNVQGDILIGVPKKVEIYYFFNIDGKRVDDFRKHLGTLVPSVTTTAKLIEIRKKIADNKSNNGGLLKIFGISIAFSHTGLELLGLKDHIDDAFNEGMLKGANSLGDSGKAGPNNTFDPEWDPAFKKGVHGLITIAGDSNDTVLEQQANVEKIFHVGQTDASIQKTLRLVGNVRPGSEEGHEHFGFLDGISQPAIDVDDKSVTPLPGQGKIRQGIALLGRDGDEKGANGRPSWTLDGSFLAFRYLPQLVPEFDDFLKKNPLPIAGLTAEQGSELLGARFVGRWKSGAPIDITPTKDDPVLAKDEKRNNNYEFGFPEDAATQTRCPFAAHVRKTNPRKDLNNATENRRILRRGIQFGPEVDANEKAMNRTTKERGLLFACYQSNIINGFQFIQQSWANKPDFIFGKNETPGFDPIIGQTPNPKDPKARIMSGTNPDATGTNTAPLPVWVLSKGGEYFFAPSIPALKNTFAAAGAKQEL